LSIYLSIYLCAGPVRAGRVLLVAAALPDIDPVIIPSTTSRRHGLTWIDRLFIVVGSALAAALLAAAVFTVVVSRSALLTGTHMPYGIT